MRVLVVDDDDSVRVGMQNLLESWGAQCVLAATPDQAYDVAQQGPALDLVICDYRLPGAHTGNQVITRLRTIHPHLRAILITGDTAPDRLREAQNSGVPLLHKPVRPVDLYRKIAQTA